MFYKYKVGWYNSYDNKEEYSEGMVYADNFGSAADRVNNAYCDVFDMYLKEPMLEGEDDYCLSKEDIDNAFKED